MAATGFVKVGFSASDKRQQINLVIPHRELGLLSQQDWRGLCVIFTSGILFLAACVIRRPYINPRKNRETRMPCDRPSSRLHKLRCTRL